MGQFPSPAAGGLPAPAPLSPQPSLLPCLPTVRKRRGAGSQKGPQGLPSAPPPPCKKKKGGEGERKQFLTTVDSVFLSGGAGFLSKVSLCVLTDTEERSQPRSSLALLRIRSGPGGVGRGGLRSQVGGGADRDGPFSSRGKKMSYGPSTLFTVGVRVREGAVTLESESQHISLP